MKEEGVFDSPDVLFDLASDSPILVVAFGGIAGRLGGIEAFEFMGTLARLDTKHAFVRDAEMSWYQRGVKGVGTDVDSVATALSRLLDVACPERVVFIGSSAGGYAAILFATLVEVDEVLAFGPQTFLDPARRTAVGDERWPRLSRRMEKRLDPRYADLRPLLENLAACRRLRIRIHHPTGEPVDVAHARNLAGVTCVRLIPHRSDVHEVVRDLRAAGALDATVAESVYGSAADPSFAAQR